MRLILILLILALAAPVHAATTLLGDVDGVTKGVPLTDITPAAIGAATEEQGGRADTAYQTVPGVSFYAAADSTNAAIEIDQSIGVSSDDRQGGIHASITRNGDTDGVSANWFEYLVTAPNNGGFDIATTHITRADNINGGTAGAQWWVAASPKTNTGNWQVYGGEINPFNRYADGGYQENPQTTAKGVYGLFMVPESELNVGAGNEQGYNATGGIAFLRSLGSSDAGSGRTFPSAKWWTPLLIGTDAIAPGGTGLLIRGGSSAQNAPGKGIKFLDHHATGIDLSGATFSGSAVKLGTTQTFTDGTVTKTLAQLAAGQAQAVSCGAGNHVSSYDPTTGIFTCTADASTSEGSTDANAIHGNTSGEIAAITTKATPVADDYLLIEDSAASNAKKKITIGSLPVGVTSISSANADIAVSGDTTPVLTLNSGTGANDIVKLDANGQLGMGATAANPITILTDSFATPPTLGGIVVDGSIGKEKIISRSYGLGKTPGFISMYSEGTPGSPTAIAGSGAVLGLLSFQGHNGTAYYNGGTIKVTSAGAWNGTDRSGYMAFSTTSGTTLAERMWLYADGGFQVGGTYGTSPGAGNIKATGTIDGKLHLTVTTATSNAVESPEILSGMWLNNTATAGAAVTYTLPTAAAGKQRCYRNYTGKTGVLTIQTSAAGQYIDLDGANTASGGNVKSGGALGDSACFVGVDSTHWIAIPNKGTWTAY